MFRIGTILFIPSYLTVVLYRPLYDVHPDDSNFILMADMLFHSVFLNEC
jgi:hypothetical protein